MKTYSKISAVLILILMCMPALKTSAQDTTWVQTLTFDSTTTRRGVWEFPDGGEQYRKILMYYTLKCDPATTADGFDCGEWDYLTYSTIYHHDGTLDSTYKSRWNFTVDGSTPDDYAYSLNPTYNYSRSFQYFINHTSVVSFDSTLIGTGIDAATEVLPTSQGSGRSQFIWTASELNSAGLTSGDISGLRMNVSTSGGPAGDFRIKMGHTSADTASAFTDTLTEVYHLNTDFGSTGWNDIQFTTPFNWNGTDNLVIEFSFGSSGATASTVLQGTSTGQPMGIAASGNDYFLDFSGGRYVNLGSGPQVEGNAPRTIEAWGRAEAFNSGGLFQAGPTGATAKDYSLRTMGTDDLWRAQLWGTPDFDVTLTGSKNNWHHYAMTYDGSTTKVYYDGVLAGQENASLSTSEHDVWIGRWSGSYFDGQIDEVRLWNAALTEGDIAAWRDRTPDVTHPNYADLAGWYTFDEGSGITVSDASPAAQADGILANIPWWGRLAGFELHKDAQRQYVRPNIILEQGVYVSTIDSVAVIDTAVNAPVMLVMYNNPAPGVQIADDDPMHPNLPTDTLIVWPANVWNYTTDAITGLVIDSVWTPADVVINKELKEWYSPEVVFEIGRFITPYGINLSLGDEGFTWVYDVTDYANLLRGDVDLSSGNNQELIDLKFAMIKGTPPRDVVRMNRVWGSYASLSYSSLDNDDALSEVTIDLAPGATTYKVRSRLTGHGHNSSTGGFPHCCEWKDNTHYLYVDGVIAHEWHIWKPDKCALNPVFPQGGTWLGAREGWCPGDLVDDDVFELTPWVSGTEVSLDYDITPVPAGNPGMGGGNYVMAFHLFQYGDPNFNLDAAVTDVHSPNNMGLYSRTNPICREPRIVIRNDGATELTSLNINYSVSGGWEETWHWTGNLAFGESEEVILPIPGMYFWQGDPSNRFTVRVSDPNGGNDEYADNDIYSTNFDMPEVLPSQMVVEMRANNIPSDNAIAIRDWEGHLVYQRLTFTANELYKDTLMLDDGCYTLYMTDAGNDGLYYWAFPEQGSGYLRLREVGASIVKNFEAEFGKSIQYSFTVGDITTGQQPIPEGPQMNLYPNPGNGLANLELEGISGEIFIRVFDHAGRLVFTGQSTVNNSLNMQLDLSNQPSGLYFVEVDGPDEMHFVRKLAIE